MDDVWKPYSIDTGIMIQLHTVDVSVSWWGRANISFNTISLQYSSLSDNTASESNDLLRKR